MLKWCAYCQKFNGEAAPFNDFCVSHGICKKCLARHTTLPNSISKEIREISHFFNKTWEHARKGAPLSPQSILDEGERLEISRTDLFMGILQPILYLIGQYFEEGEIDVKTEHRFSAIVNQIIAHCEKEEQEHRNSSEENIDILFVEARGNTHTIGLHFLRLFLQEHNISSKHTFANSNIEATKKIIEWESPLLVGVSLAQSKQISFVNKLIKSLKHDIPVYVGGSLFKTDNEKDKLHLLSPYAQYAEVAELVEIIQNKKQQNVA